LISTIDNQFAEINIPTGPKCCEST